MNKQPVRESEYADSLFELAALTVPAVGVLFCAGG